MFRKSLVSSMYALLLIGCTGRGFQPPPPEFTNWKKIGLWAVLLLSVVFLGAMAFSLLRKPPTNS